MALIKPYPSRQAIGSLMKDDGHLIPEEVDNEDVKRGDKDLDTISSLHLPKPFVLSPFAPVHGEAPSRITSAISSISDDGRLQKTGSLPIDRGISNDEADHATEEIPNDDGRDEIVNPNKTKTPNTARPFTNQLQPQSSDAALPTAIPIIPPLSRPIDPPLTARPPTSSLRMTPMKIPTSPAPQLRPYDNTPSIHRSATLNLHNLNLRPPTASASMGAGDSLEVHVTSEGGSSVTEEYSIGGTTIKPSFRTRPRLNSGVSALSGLSAQTIQQSTGSTIRPGSRFSADRHVQEYKEILAKLGIEGAGMSLETAIPPRVPVGVDELDVEWCYLCGKEGRRDQLRLADLGKNHQSSTDNGVDGREDTDSREALDLGLQWVCRNYCGM